MPSWVAVLGNGSVCRHKARGRTGGCATLHAPRALPRRPMRMRTPVLRERRWRCSTPGRRSRLAAPSLCSVSGEDHPTHTRTVARRSASPGDAVGWIGGSRPPSPWPRRSGHPHPRPRVPAPRRRLLCGNARTRTRALQRGNRGTPGAREARGGRRQHRGHGLASPPSLHACCRALLEALVALTVPHVTSILGRPNQGVQRLVDGMRGASEDHPAMAHPHPACGRGQCAPPTRPHSPRTPRAACAFFVPARARAWLCIHDPLHVTSLHRSHGTDLAVQSDRKSLRGDLLSPGQDRVASRHGRDRCGSLGRRGRQRPPAGLLH